MKLLIIARSDYVQKYSHLSNKYSYTVMYVYGTKQSINRIKIDNKKEGYNIDVKHIDEFKGEILKFDYIVGNPPYQGKGSNASNLYIDISRKALTLLKPNGVIDFLTPTTIAQVKKTGFTLQGQLGLKVIDYTADKMFNVGIKICRWKIDKSYSGDVKVIEEDGTSEYRKYTDVMVQSKDRLGFELFEKIKMNKNKLFIGDQTTNNKRTSEKSNIYKYKIHVNTLKNKIEYSRVKPKLYKQKKIIIHMGMTYNDKNFQISTEDFGQYQNQIPIDNLTDTQIQNIKDFLFSDICINLCKKYRVLYNTGMNNILYSFPKIDYNHKYSEQDIIKLFKLTDKEVIWLKK